MPGPSLRPLCLLGMVLSRGVLRVLRASAAAATASCICAGAGLSPDPALAAPTASATGNCSSSSGRLARWSHAWKARYGTTPGFHRWEPNKNLRENYARLVEGLGGGGNVGGSVLVPLCGKTVDMLWLAAQGHRVVGVEGVQQAIDQFQDESCAMQMTKDATGVTVWKGTDVPGISIVQTDYLQLSQTTVGEQIDFVWDRAALVAIEPSDREEYAAKTASLCASRAKILLNTVEYPGPPYKMLGPPFSVSLEEVKSLYEPHGFVVEDILREPAEDQSRGKFAKLEGAMDERVFLLSRQ